MPGRRQVPSGGVHGICLAALLGWIFFSETLTFTTLLGTAMIVTGCLVAAWQTGEIALMLRKSGRLSLSLVCRTLIRQALLKAAEPCKSAGITL